MSVIGYVIQCENCAARMVVTAEAKNMRNCPECLTDAILETIERHRQSDDEAQPRQPYETPLLPWELELLGRNDDGDDDYPVGQVQG